MSSPGAGLQAPRTARHSRANAIFVRCQRDLEILSSIISSLIFIHVPRRSMEPFFFFYSAHQRERGAAASAHSPNDWKPRQAPEPQDRLDVRPEVCGHSRRRDSQSALQAEKSAEWHLWCFFGGTFWIIVLIARTTRPRHSHTLLLLLFAMFEILLSPQQSEIRVFMWLWIIFFIIGIQGCIMTRWSRGHFQPHPLGLHVTAAATTVFQFWVNN